jgi:hypothetical protein
MTRRTWKRPLEIHKAALGGLQIPVIFWRGFSFQTMIGLAATSAIARCGSWYAFTMPEKSADTVAPAIAGRARMTRLSRFLPEPDGAKR